MDKENLFSYWGKARPADPNSPAYHPLPYHCLDVAAVGEVYLKRHPRLLDFLAKKTGAPLELVLEWVRLLLFLHDLVTALLFDNSGRTVGVFVGAGRTRQPGVATCPPQRWRFLVLCDDASRIYPAHHMMLVRAGAACRRVALA